MPSLPPDLKPWMMRPRAGQRNWPRRRRRRLRGGGDARRSASCRSSASGRFAGSRLATSAAAWPAFASPAFALALAAFVGLGLGELLGSSSDLSVSSASRPWRASSRSDRRSRRRRACASLALSPWPSWSPRLSARFAFACRRRRRRRLLVPCRRGAPSALRVAPRPTSRLGASRRSSARLVASRCRPARRGACRHGSPCTNANRWRSTARLPARHNGCRKDVAALSPERR